MMCISTRRFLRARRNLFKWSSSSGDKSVNTAVIVGVEKTEFFAIIIATNVRVPDRAGNEVQNVHPKRV